MFKATALALVAAFAVGAHAQCDGTILDIVSMDPELSVLADTVQSKFADVAAMFDLNTTAYTLFSPIDDAFALIEVPTDMDVLLSVLASHAVEGAYPSTALTEGVPLMVSAISGAELTLLKTDGMVTVSTGNSSAMVLEADMMACGGGVIHKIDEVLIPDFDALMAMEEGVEGEVESTDRAPVSEADADSSAMTSFAKAAALVGAAAAAVFMI